MPREEEEQDQAITTATDDNEPEEVSTEPDVNDDDDGAKAGEDDAQKASRNARRQNRFREAKEAAEEANRRLQDTERRLTEETAARVAAQEASRQVQQYAVIQQQSRQQDPWEEAFSQVDREARAIVNEANRLKAEGKWDDAAADRVQTEYGRVQRKQQTLVVQQENARRDWAARQQAPNQQLAAAEAAYAARLATEFPEVTNHPQAFSWAIFEYQKATKAEGKPDSWETASKVMNEAAMRFKLRKAPAPDEATRRRYSGVGGGSNGGTNGHKGGTIQMIPAFRKMAESRYKDLAKKDPKLAWKKWAENEGKSVMEDD
jgi:hypothetical protein